MQILKILFAGIVLSFLWSCSSEEDPEFVYPKDYFPVYPGSYWVYSNGEVIKTSSEYVKHSYETSISSTEKSEDMYVPKYGDNYVYGYQMTQNSNIYPLRTIMKEDKSSSWTVNEYNGLVTQRKMISPPDSLVITFYGGDVPVDSVFKDCFVVVEYIEELGYKNWNRKEYYVKGTGLVRVDIKDQTQENDQGVIYKTLIDCKINK
jgi:hypothetical protein